MGLRKDAFDWNIVLLITEENVANALIKLVNTLERGRMYKIYMKWHVHR